MLSARVTTSLPRICGVLRETKLLGTAILANAVNQRAARHMGSRLVYAHLASMAALPRKFEPKRGIGRVVGPRTCASDASR